MTPLGFRKPEAVAAVSDILPSLFAATDSAGANRSANFLWSVLLHTLAVAALLTLTRVAPGLKWNGSPPPILDLRDAVFTTPLALIKDHGGGGSGHDQTPSSRGVLPQVSQLQFTPPTVHIPNPAPQLPMEESIVAPDIRLARMKGEIGDPFEGVLGIRSDGQHRGTGIGNAPIGAGGMGPQPWQGAGVGTTPGVAVPGGRGGVTSPRPIYTPDPEYSEEARKIKQQGTVVLWVVVGADGRVRDVRVQRSLGFGLDEKALEAVRTWKFKPATVDDRPVAVQVNVEVRFRLY